MSRIKKITYQSFLIPCIDLSFPTLGETLIRGRRSFKKQFKLCQGFTMCIVGSKVLFFWPRLFFNKISLKPITTRITKQMIYSSMDAFFITRHNNFDVFILDVCKRYRKKYGWAPSKCRTYLCFFQICFYVKKEVNIDFKKIEGIEMLIQSY